MQKTVRFLPLLVVAGVVLAVGWAASPKKPTPNPASVATVAEVEDVNRRVVAIHEQRLADAELADAAPIRKADDLTVLRRLSLALHGTVPSLQEIREFEADEGPDRLARWADRMLDDPRFAEYFSVRLSRSFVGADEGQFVVFRRDRFQTWLAEQLAENQPYDEIVRSMIAEDGLWTDAPATNFVTATYANEKIDYAKLAGRTVRAFLGQRIDCAQCHDHPFDDWKQTEFEGLAAFYGNAKVSIRGVEDARQSQYEVEDRETLEKSKPEAAVPFHPEWLPEGGTPREQLAAWITHPENERFERAIANRVWGLMFGKPYSAGHVFSTAGRPVDDLPDPPTSGDGEPPDVLGVLGEDFREHDYDLRRLIHAIAATPAFRAPSDHIVDGDDGTAVDALVGEWAVFPIVRLRPEQVIGSMLQSASVTTIDQNSQLLVRLVRFFRERDFVREYGDLGENELDEHAGTIPQALLRMNGQLVREIGEANAFTASGRIAGFSGTPETAIENAYLACLTRRPTAEETAFFVEWFKDARPNQRGKVVEDLYWALFNSPEFAWNH